MVLLFFLEYKITHQQASFECVESVFTHCLLTTVVVLKVTTIENFLNTGKLAKVFSPST